MFWRVRAKQPRRDRQATLHGVVFDILVGAGSVPSSAGLSSQPPPFGATASVRFAWNSRVWACRAEARAAGEGWWGKKDSNLRSHKTADLQSAPFATRDTPPLGGTRSGPLVRATISSMEP